MSTLRVNTIQDTAGSGSPSIAGAAKAWVNFNGTGTVAIRAALNVSSITDLGLGYYQLNFTTALPDANYSPIIGVSDISWGAIATLVNSSLMTTSNFRFYTFAASTSTNNAGDPEVCTVAVFR